MKNLFTPTSISNKKNQPGRKDHPQCRRYDLRGPGQYIIDHTEIGAMRRLYEGYQLIKFLYI